jgi:hypothetical protein
MRSLRDVVPRDPALRRDPRLPGPGPVRAWSSPGAPHRGGGLPASEPGLDAGAQDLGRDRNRRRGVRARPVRCADGTDRIHGRRGPRRLRRGGDEQGTAASDRWTVACGPCVPGCYRRRPGHECQRTAPARWPATLLRGGVPRVMTGSGPNGPGKRGLREAAESRGGGPHAQHRTGGGPRSLHGAARVPAARRPAPGLQRALSLLTRPTPRDCGARRRGGAARAAAQPRSIHVTRPPTGCAH